MSLNDCINYLTTKNADCAHKAGNASNSDDRAYARQEMKTLNFIFQEIKDMHKPDAHIWFEKMIESAQEEVNNAIINEDKTMIKIESLELVNFQQAYKALMK